MVSFPLMSHDLHICFISSSSPTHLFIFPVYVLGMYLLRERTFAITSPAFMMFLLALFFYYTSSPGPHQSRKRPSTYRIQVGQNRKQNLVLKFWVVRKPRNSWLGGEVMKVGVRAERRAEGGMCVFEKQGWRREMA